MYILSHNGSQNFLWDAYFFKIAKAFHSAMKQQIPSLNEIPLFSTKDDLKRRKVKVELNFFSRFFSF